ncbi:MAG: DUF4926 domain-containing protein [Candidatus Electrothrix sp. AU1_5]|nr:DUF4926 domain-containing protein [Candidatus Electrothrix gigas]
MKANIGDIVELIKDIPEHRLQAGMRAAIVHCHGNAVYELEFSNEQGGNIDYGFLECGPVYPGMVRSNGTVGFTGGAGSCPACLTSERGGSTGAGLCLFSFFAGLRGFCGEGRMSLLPGIATPASVNPYACMDKYLNRSGGLSCILMELPSRISMEQVVA